MTSAMKGDPNETGMLAGAAKQVMSKVFADD
jgi:hypothetical protein